MENTSDADDSYAPTLFLFMATVLLSLIFLCHSTIANAAVALGATRNLSSKSETGSIACHE